MHCFPAFLHIPPPQFKLVLDSIIWAFKHTMRNVADTGLAVSFRTYWYFSALKVKKKWTLVFVTDFIPIVIEFTTTRTSCAELLRYLLHRYFTTCVYRRYWYFAYSRLIIEILSTIISKVTVFNGIFSVYFRVSNARYHFSVHVQIGGSE